MHENLPAIQSAFERGDYDALVGLGLLDLAIAGCVEAQELAGNCYQLGLGVAVDLTQAVYWYTQAIEQNSGLAVSNLAGIISRGYDDHLPNRERAQRLLDQARSLGFDHAPEKLLC
jgi:TPR repeat protein